MSPSLNVPSLKLPITIPITKRPRQCWNVTYNKTKPKCCMWIVLCYIYFDKVCTVTVKQGWEFAHSLKLLRTNELMWVIRSGRSGQMSDCERISQVAHDKWANMSDSLRSLRRNVRSWANRSGRSLKMSKWTNRSLFEQIAHLLTFLAKKEQFAPKFDERIPNPAVKKAYVRQRVDMETNAFKVWQITVFKNSVLLILHCCMQKNTVPEVIYYLAKNKLRCKSPRWILGFFLQ